MNPSPKNKVRKSQWDSLIALEVYFERVSLGGGHPTMIVVPRDDLAAILAVAHEVLRPAESSPACPADPKEQTRSGAADGAGIANQLDGLRPYQPSPDNSGRTE